LRIPVSLIDFEDWDLFTTGVMNRTENHIRRTSSLCCRNFDILICLTVSLYCNSLCIRIFRFPDHFARLGYSGFIFANNISKYNITKGKLIPLIFFLHRLSEDNTTGTTGEAGTVYFSGAHEFTLSFIWGLCCFIF